MTDATFDAPTGAVRKLDFSGAAARARIKRRYRAETRFRSYGIFSLMLATVFLVGLISDILMRGVPAFWQHSLVLQVPVSAAEIDPAGTRDVATLRNADYAALIRTGLAAAVPGIEGRTAEKKLNGLVSSGAGDALRDLVVTNPSVIGKTVDIRALLTGDGDLYFKGVGTPIVERTVVGKATPSAVTGDIKITSSANDFALDVRNVKAELTKRASALTTEIDRLIVISDKTLAPRIESLREEVAALRARVDEAKTAEILDEKLPSTLVAINGGLVKVTSLRDTEIEGTVLVPLKTGAEAGPSAWKVVTYATPEGNRKATDYEVAFLEKLKAEGRVERNFNWQFFTSGDSREAELAGIGGSLVGTTMTLLITLGLCLPIGVMAAIYLEEFAPRNWFTSLVEVNINNLAAVPSIVFGLLGLAVFLNEFGLPRSAPLVGGLVLALLVVPTIIIASRAAIRSVPPSIKEAALGVGASKQQAVFHHVLPLAMPGIMTGTIIGMAHALGETAPLLMIGMVAFIVDVPKGFTEAATVLPVQVYLWSDLPEAAFQSKTAAAIIVLLMFLFVMNGLAIWLRKKFERRW
jgi:phosphate transport system permease protein